MQARERGAAPDHLEQEEDCDEEEDLGVIFWITNGEKDIQ